MNNRKIKINQTIWYWCETLPEKMSLCHTFRVPCEYELRTTEPDWLGVTLDNTHDVNYYSIESFNQIRKDFEKLERRLWREWKNYEDR